MSITDELRDFARRWPCTDYICKDMLAIADRIDAEHESACAEAYGNGVMSVPIALDESAWVELPKDADGEPIHVGDVMEERSGHTFEVASLMAFGGSENWLALSDPRNFSSFREPHDIRHYHAPTVEDVLQKLLEQAVGYSDAHTTVALNTIAEYAAKLRLAEEDA